jgi:hypothetical protein
MRLAIRLWISSSTWFLYISSSKLVIRIRVACLPHVCLTVWHGPMWHLEAIAKITSLVVLLYSEVRVVGLWRSHNDDTYRQPWWWSSFSGVFTIVLVARPLKAIMFHDDLQWWLY